MQWRRVERGMMRQRGMLRAARRRYTLAFRQTLTDHKPCKCLHQGGYAQQHTNANCCDEKYLLWQMCGLQGDLIVAEATEMVAMASADVGKPHVMVTGLVQNR